MKIKLLILTAIFFAGVNCFAQTYPAFNVTAYDSTQSTGYYFFCPYQLSAYPTFPPNTQHQMILDSKGNVVYFNMVAGHFAGDFKVHNNGLMSFIGGGQFYLMDSTFTIIDSVTTVNGIVYDLHDLQITPDHHYILLGNEDVTMDLSGYPIFLGNGTPGGHNTIVRGFVLQELDSLKNLVFEWHSIQHFSFDDVDEFWLTDTNIVDWTHVNAVDLDNDGNFLVSSRHFNEITKISRADSSIIWRLGGKRNDFAFINDSMMFRAQHDCRKLPNGNLTLFDNGRGGPAIHYGSAKEYELDEVNHTATLVWSHFEDVTNWSRSQGNTQRLPNGNTLTGYGNLTPDPIVFNVVDPMQNKVFEVVFPDSQITYRAFNYPTLPWSFNRPQISCGSDGSQTVLSADSGYSKYIWSTGDTTQTITISATGVYSVFVPTPNGGYLSSEMFEVADLTDPCRLVGIENASTKNISIYPNPAGNTLYISSTSSLPGVFEIADLTGRIWQTGITNGASSTSINVQGLAPGIYILRSGNYQAKFVKF